MLGKIWWRKISKKHLILALLIFNIAFCLCKAGLAEKGWLECVLPLSESVGQGQPLLIIRMWNNRYPSSLVGLLAQAKIGDEQFWEGSACAHEWSSFFVFEREGGIFCFLKNFPLFPNWCVLIMFPIAPRFYLIWFAQSSTPMYINWKGAIKGNTFVSILQPGVLRGPSIRECFNEQKNWWWANEHVDLSQRKKKKEVIITPIN
jgi:hypothetical protein